MPTRSITITDEAYQRLASFKENKESFSDVINKLTRKSSLMELAGILSPKEANELEDNIKEIRKSIRKRVDETAEKLK
ncbi:antitoxin VapB family protein [Candidatus Woesearchaeota archaeon]|nr:antitoxin VapB family protein [Candidatus Woesearchaeota archaeon]